MKPPTRKRWIDDFSYKEGYADGYAHHKRETKSSRSEKGEDTKGGMVKRVQTPQFQNGNCRKTTNHPLDTETVHTPVKTRPRNSEFPNCEKYGLTRWGDYPCEPCLKAYDVEIALSRLTKEREDDLATYNKTLKFFDEQHKKNEERIADLEKELKEKNTILDELNLNWNVHGNQAKIMKLKIKTLEAERNKARKFLGKKDRKIERLRAELKRATEVIRKTSYLHKMPELKRRR